jgi:hypothetical protein
MNLRRSVGIIALADAALIASGVALPPAAVADSCNGAGSGGGDSVTVSIECSQGNSVLQGSPAADGPFESGVIYETLWHTPCASFTPASAGLNADCGLARVCRNPDERLWNIWGRNSASGEWELLGSECSQDAPAPTDDPAPARVTPGMVLEEIRRIGLPTLEARTQPEGKTLVNFDTIFYTEAQPFTTTVRLLGRSVDIEARPTGYTWHHGDGSVTRTGEPGAPYPAMDITHRYQRANTTVRPRVDVTYAARFRVAGGGWQDIDETVTIPGPEGSLEIREASPKLSGDYG